MTNLFKNICLIFYLSFQILIAGDEGITLDKPNDINFEQITIEDGLSSNRVICILQDSRGLMWFGTENGLNKYDGYKFTTFNPDPENPGSISHPFIYSILEDNNGDIWIGTYGGGLNKYDRKQDLFVNYQHDPKNPNSISNNFVSSLSLSSSDSGRYLWVGTRWGGLNKFDLKLKKFNRFGDSSQDTSNIYTKNIVSLHEDREGILWIGTLNSGLINYNPKTHKFKSYHNDPENKYSISDDHIRTITQDYSGVLWIGTDNGINNFDISQQRFIRYQCDKNIESSISDNRVLSIAEKHNGDLWIGTFCGLNIFNQDTENFYRICSENNDFINLSNDYITSIFHDKTGTVWIGTLGGGINKYVPNAKQFNHIRIKIDNSNQTSINSIRSIQEDIFDNKNILWLGTVGAGLFQFNREKNQFKQIYKGGETVFVRSIYQNSSFPNTIWIGTWGTGLIKIDKKHQHPPEQVFWSNYPENKDTYHINTIFEINTDIVWLGTGLGIYQFNLLTEKYTHFGYVQDDNNSLSHPNVTSILKDHLGQFWIGTHGGGLNKLVARSEQVNINHESNKILHLKNDPGNKSSISSNNISFIYEDQNDNLWIGTLGGGLNKRITINVQYSDKIQEKFKRYTEKDGLASNSILGILEDDIGNLWLSTKKGISKFDPVTETFINYDGRDGLQSKEFNRFAYFKSSDGEMFFGGINGFNLFYPDKIINNQQIPTVVITDFQIFNKSVKPDRNINFKTAISESKEIILMHDQTDFSFEFAALSYTIPEKNQYAYKMEGVDLDWVYTDASRRFVTYAHLDPGDYIFRVKASNNDGIWNEEGTSIAIKILPPWWATTFAYMVYGILFLISIYAIREYELRRIHLKHDLEIKERETEKLGFINAEKSRFFAGISHEFRTPLTLILGPAERLLNIIKNKKQMEDIKRIKYNAHRMNKLVDMYLDLSMLESGSLSIKKSNEDIIPILKNLVASFESHAEEKNILIQFKNFFQSILCKIDKEKFEQIMINLINNAIKFTPSNGKVSVYIQPGFTKNHVSIIIADNGIGIAESQLDRIFEMFYQIENDINERVSGTGIGLAMVKELINLHDAEISVKSKLGQGTEFHLYFPVIDIEYGKSKKVIVEPITVDQELFSSSIEDITLDGRTRILIVEDNHEMRKFIESLIEDNFYTKTCYDGIQGIECAIEFLPDLIISDVMMPNMDGYEFAEIIKNDLRTSHIPIILLTAKTKKPDKLQGLKTGADAYITKPFNPEELLICIDNLLENRKRIHQKFNKDKFFNPSEIDITSADEKFLLKCHQVVEDNLSNSDFNMENFASDVHLSRTQLHKKLKALTGHSATEYVKTIRIKKAAILLESGFGNITEIAYETGFSNPSYFTECFKKFYKISPIKYSQSFKS